MLQKPGPACQGTSEDGAAPGKGEMGKLVPKTQFLKKLWAVGGKGLSYGSERR